MTQWSYRGTMLTIPEAARRIGRDPQTVRRWIRSGRLRARKVGRQNMIELDGLERVGTPGDDPAPAEAVASQAARHADARSGSSDRAEPPRTLTLALSANVGFVIAPSDL